MKPEDKGALLVGGIVAGVLILFIVLLWFFSVKPERDSCEDVGGTMLRGACLAPGTVIHVD